MEAKTKKPRWKKVLLIIIIVILVLIAGLFIFLRVFMGKSGMMGIFQSVDASGKMQAESFTASNGVVLPYRISLPQNYDAGTEYPLVLFLHGSGERGADNKKQAAKNSIMQTLLSDENAAEYPCIIVAPQCPEDVRWSVMIAADGDQFYPDEEEPLLDAVMELLSSVEAEYSVDENRIYATGISMGAGGIYSLLMHNPDTFAAAVVTCGYAPLNGAELLKDLPLQIYHGDKDFLTSVEYSRDFVTALDNIGAKNYTYTEYKGENHFVWELAFREEGLYPWLFAQSK